MSLPSNLVKFTAIAALFAQSCKDMTPKQESAKDFVKTTIAKTIDWSPESRVHPDNPSVPGRDTLILRPLIAADSGFMIGVDSNNDDILQKNEVSMARIPTDKAGTWLGFDKNMRSMFLLNADHNDSLPEDPSSRGHAATFEQAVKSSMNTLKL
jgi:hypothetical protein